MKRFATLIVALAMVLSMTPALQMIKAADPIRNNLDNKPATMVFVKWYRVGYDRDGNMLNPNTINPADVTRQNAGGLTYRMFPWQKEGQEIWGRPSVNTAYELPRIIPSLGFTNLGRLTTGNPNFNYTETIEQYAWWTEFFLNVTPKAGESQEADHWYGVIDKSGNLWLDPDGVFHNCTLDLTADPNAYLQNGQSLYTEGSCLNNPKATVDPLPANNTQGPYPLNPNDSNLATNKIYFWWKYDQLGNSVDRLFKVGWADMVDYDPIPNHYYDWNATNVPNPRVGFYKTTYTTDTNGRCPPIPAGGDETLANNISRVSYIPTYDPYLNTCIPQHDIDWDFKLNTRLFTPTAPFTVWPNVSSGAEVFWDANGNDRYDPYEYIYRKAQGFFGFAQRYLEVNDVRLMNTSATFGSERGQYRYLTNVMTTDLDYREMQRLNSLGAAGQNRMLKPMNPTSRALPTPANFPYYVHTDGNRPGNPNDAYDFDEFIYQKNALNPNWAYTNLTNFAFINAITITVASTAGLAIGDTIIIYGQGTNQAETRTIVNILPGNVIVLNTPLGLTHFVGALVAERGYVELDDIRLSNVNKRRNNIDDSFSWSGMWWNDALVLLEVLNGGCATPKYNITVETDLWEGMNPAVTAAALRSPSGDIIAAAQHVQKTTVLDPKGLEFRVPATTFENIKLEYREYIGVEVFKDNGINNNLGDIRFGADQNSIQSSMSDDYALWQNTEEYVGCTDEELAKDYRYANFNNPFFGDDLYMDISNDNYLGAGEPIYRDLDVSRSITAGDLRLTSVTLNSGTTIISYPAGTKVTAGDKDIGYNTGLMRAIPTDSVRYADLVHGCEAPNQQYDIGEPIYYNPGQDPARMTQTYPSGFGSATYTSFAFDPAPYYTPTDFTLVDETNSNVLRSPSTSMNDQNNVYVNPNETILSHTRSGGVNPWPPAMTAPIPFPFINGTMRLQRGEVFFANPSTVNRNVRFDTQVAWNNAATGLTYGAAGVVFRYANDENYTVAYLMPGSPFGTWNWRLPTNINGGYTTYGVSGPILLIMIVQYIKGQGYLLTTNQSNPLPYDPSLNGLNVTVQIANTITMVTVTNPATPLNYFQSILPENDIFGPIGFSKYADSGTYGTSTSYFYFDNVILRSGSSMDIIRLNDVYAGDVVYPAGSRVGPGDFYRLKNPIYGITTGRNCSRRYVDVDVLPGDIGLKVEVDKPLKVEQTSHIKISIDPPPAGEYLTGKVIGDLRSRLFYKPDSFFVRMIPKEYQVIFSSPSDAKTAFFKPDKSIIGDIVYVGLRNVDVQEANFTSSLQIRDVWEKTGIIDAKHPTLEWEFTPYRGTILDQIGQDMPVRIMAFMDKGGPANDTTATFDVEFAPRDSRFTFALNQYNSGGRTVDPVSSVYMRDNYIDPFYLNAVWTNKEAWTNYYNQAYTKAARLVYSPYQLQMLAGCELDDAYDCFGQAKLHVEPEGIELIPSSPCVDPLSYRYPNATLTLKAFDNPNDVNDPAGYLMTTTSPTADNRPSVAVYNVNGAGIKCMMMARRWSRNTDVNPMVYYIVQINDDGSYHHWQMTENAATVPGFPQIAGVLDPNDILTPDWWNPTYNNVDPFNMSNYIARGSNTNDVGDADCSVGTGTVDLCGSGFPPLGDYSPFDTYGNFWDPPPNALGEIYCYGVQTFISYATQTDIGGKISLCFQPINSNSKVNIRVHTTNLMIDYNQNAVLNPQDGTPWSYFITDRSTQYNWGSGAGLPDYRTNPPGFRRLALVDTVDYCDVISLKVLPPDPDLNFNNMYMVDHALQYSNIRYNTPGGGSLLDTDEMGVSRPIRDPKKWVQPPYNPLCVYRPLSSDVNTDVRAYPGGQTHLGRAVGLTRGAGFNAYPSMWPRLYNKLGTEFYGLTDYGLYFQLSQAPSPGNFGKGIDFTRPAINGGPVIKRIEITGPFMTPYDFEPNIQRIAYRAGTGTGSLLGYSYKGLRYVPIKYDYSGKIIVDSVNWQSYLYQGGANLTNVTQLLATNIGDRIYGTTNPLLFVGKELDYSRVFRYNNHVFVFDELIMNGPGRIEITVWLNNGIKKIYQDCCVEPPATGIDVSGIKIEGMPNKITVDEPSTLKLKLTEGYGVDNPGPPVEYGKKIQEYRECNDAFAFVWQDRGVLDPIDKLFKGAGDGYCTMPPMAKYSLPTYYETGTAYNEEDDLNGDNKISFDQYETEILGSYDMASSTWLGGIIDARTFQRNKGEYSFALEGSAMPTTVGIDFGQRGVLTTQDHVIGEDEMLDITVTAYKYGDDDNSRSFRPLYGGREPTSTDRRFSHEVYLAGQVAASVEAKQDLVAEITPALVTSGITPELVDPTKPLGFTLRDANQKPIDLTHGVPDPRGGDEVKIENAWMHLFKDPHPDDNYYFPGQLLPRYYWLRTDLHNDDYTPICNQRLYSYPRYPFKPIKFNWIPSDGVYNFLGFVANDKGKFNVHIYTPDRRHKAVAEVVVELPKVTYDLNGIKLLAGQERMSSFIPTTGENEKEDFVCTAADLRAYFCNITMKTAEGKLIQGLAETTSVCMGGQGQNARFTPFYTRPEHYNWVALPGTSFGNGRRTPTSVITSSTWLNSARGNSWMYVWIDSNNNNTFGDVPRDSLLFGNYWVELGIRLYSGLATYYPTVNMQYDDGSYSPYQCWDGPFDKPSVGPQGYGIGCIYNNEYEKEYIFSDANRDFTFNFKDSLLINNRGQGTVILFADDAGKFGVTVGVTDHAMVPSWSDIYGGTDPYNEYSPQRMQTRFVHVMSGNQDLGTTDGAYALDWDSMPNHYVDMKYPNVKLRWAETGEEVEKTLLDQKAYDLAYGVQNHLIAEFLPADPRDLPMHTAEQSGASVMVAFTNIMHPWGGNKSENVVRASVTSSPINARTRMAQFYATPTGTGQDTMSIDLDHSPKYTLWPISRTYNLIKLDVIMSLQVVAETNEPLKVGRSVPMTVTVLETSGKPVPNAKVHIKGAGVEMEKDTGKDGKITFNVSPTERGRITVTANAENMKGAYTTVFVDPYVAPPTLDVDPVQAVVGTDSVTITGRTNEGSRITVNGKPVTVSADGKFTSTQKLQSGMNTIVITATNNSGQVVSKVIRVESRTQPSGIIIDQLGTFENVTLIRVRGHVEPGSKVVVTSDASGKQVEALVTNDVFVADVDVKAGNNQITVEATDVVGKKSTPKTITVYVFTRIEVGLQIGSQVIYINGVPSRLPVAPVVKGGSTMVPFRAIAEAFGAKAEFEAATKTIKVTWENNTLEMVIGKKEALKNGVPVQLTAAPEIQGGSTLVPFRFVEIFGNVEVGYNSTTKTITAIRRF